MGRLAALLLLAAVAIGLQATDVSIASAQSRHTQAGQPVLEEQPECSTLVPPLQPDSGVLVMTTNPRWSGVRVIVDEQEHLTDAIGCLVLEVPQGDHVVELPSIEEDEQWQTLDGLVRSIRSGWPRPVVVGAEPVELQLTVGPPVCELLDPQPTPRSLAARAGEDTSLLVISTVLDETVARKGQLHQMRDQEGAAATVCDWSATAQNAEAAYRLERRVGQRHTVGPERHRLGEIRGLAEPARRDQRDVGRVASVEVASGTRQRRNSRH